MKIYIAFYKAFQPRGSFTDRLIALWTIGMYSHTEIIIYEENDYYMYSSSPRDGGVRRKKHTWNNIVWDYMEIEVNEQQIELIKEFFYKIEGDSYDWRGVLGFALPLKDAEHKWFCSETTSNALKIIGHKNFLALKPETISPNRLKRILNCSDFQITFFKRLANLIMNFPKLFKKH